jgi:hypothetical protein
VTGVPSASQASEIPAIDSANCHITSGRSGLPKFRQFVIASGRAPVTATFRAASATACIAPSFGSRRPYRPLPSLETTTAFSVPGTRITAPSESGPATVLPWTMRSYCRQTHRFDAMAGEARSEPSASASDPSNGVSAGSVASGATGASRGRSYSGPSSARERAGTSATTSPR